MAIDPTDTAEIALINLSFALAELNVSTDAGAMDRIRGHIDLAVFELIKLAPRFAETPARAAQAA